MDCNRTLLITLRQIKNDFNDTSKQPHMIILIFSEKTISIQDMWSCKEARLITSIMEIWKKTGEGELISNIQAINKCSFSVITSILEGDGSDGITWEVVANEIFKKEFLLSEEHEVEYSINILALIIKRRRDIFDSLMENNDFQRQIDMVAFTGKENPKMVSVLEKFAKETNQVIPIV